MTEIRSIEHSERWGGRLFLVVWIILTVGTWLVAVMTKDLGFYGGAAAFTLVALAVLVYEVIRTLKLRKYGVVTLGIDPNPIELGRRFRARADFVRGIEAGVPIAVTVSCERHWMERRPDASGKGTTVSARSETVWEEQRNAATRPVGTGVKVVVDVITPREHPPTEKPGLIWKRNHDYFLWFVRFEIQQPGLDFVRTYEVPTV